MARAATERLRKRELPAAKRLGLVVGPEDHSRGGSELLDDVPEVDESAAAAAVRDLRDRAGKVIVDCTNPMRWEDGPVWAPPTEGSNAAAIAAAAPGARVVKGFNIFGADFHANPTLAAGPVDVQLAGDAEARVEVAAIARAAGFEPVDAGPLRNAAVLENLAMLWIHLAMVGGHGRQVGFQASGEVKSPASMIETSRDHGAAVTQLYSPPHPVGLSGEVPAPTV
jgi:hypothetical protein